MDIYRPKSELDTIGQLIRPAIERNTIGEPTGSLLHELDSVGHKIRPAIERNTLGEPILSDSGGLNLNPAISVKEIVPRPIPDPFPIPNPWVIPGL